MTLSAPLNFCHKVSVYNRYYEEPKTLGEHIRKKQLDNNLTLNQVCEAIGITKQTALRWEQEPPNRIQEKKYPAIANFLGYCPIDSYPQNFGQHLKLIRSWSGYSREEMGKEIGTCPKTIARLEDDKFLCHIDVLEKILEFVKEKTGITYTSKRYKDLTPSLYRYGVRKSPNF